MSKKSSSDSRVKRQVVDLTSDEDDRAKRPSKSTLRKTQICGQRLLREAHELIVVHAYLKSLKVSQKDDLRTEARVPKTRPIPSSRPPANIRKRSTPSQARTRRKVPIPLLPGQTTLTGFFPVGPGLSRPTPPRLTRPPPLKASSHRVPASRGGEKSRAPEDGGGGGGGGDSSGSDGDEESGDGDNDESDKDGENGKGENGDGEDVDSDAGVALSAEHIPLPLSPTTSPTFLDLPLAPDAALPIAPAANVAPAAPSHPSIPNIPVNAANPLHLGIAPGLSGLLNRSGTYCYNNSLMQVLFRGAEFGERLSTHQTNCLVGDCGFCRTWGAYIPGPGRSERHESSGCHGLVPDLQP